MPEEEIIIAIDPGTKKCGYAVVDFNLSILQREVISTDETTKAIEGSLNIYKIDKIVLGNGTNYKSIEEKLKNLFPQLKIIPLSLRVPPGHYDDFAAVFLAEKYFRNKISR